MIDSLVIDMIDRFAPPPKDHDRFAMCLGDQEMMDKSKGPTARDFFRKRGYPLFKDIDYNERASINVDLNYDVKDLPYEVADLVYDGGVIEHVCNIGEGLIALTRLPRVGGIVIGNWPVNHSMHESYYNLNPILPQDFFRANGFEVLYHSLYRTMNWRLWCMRAVMKYLPLKTVEKLRLHFRKQAEDVRESLSGFEQGTLKSFIFQDRLSNTKFYPIATRRTLKPLTSQIFVARKVRSVPGIHWPNQEFYPKMATDATGTLLTT